MVMLMIAMMLVIKIVMMMICEHLNLCPISLPAHRRSKIFPQY